MCAEGKLRFVNEVRSTPYAGGITRVTIGPNPELLFMNMDTLTSLERSERMSRIKGKDTKPELAIRRLLHRMGYRYRLHSAVLPGKPDLVFASRRKVIFVHGCFWHRHFGCKLARVPKSKLEFWVPKLEANASRDSEVQRKLAVLGWKVLVIWECEVKEEAALARRAKAFLDDTRNEE